MTDIDAYRCASILLQQHGDKAAAYAVLRQASLLAAEDQAGADAWRRIEVAIHVMSKQEPDMGEAKH